MTASRVAVDNSERRWSPQQRKRRSLLSMDFARVVYFLATFLAAASLSRQLLPSNLSK
jgi:hypothetical protein